MNTPKDRLKLILAFDEVEGRSDGVVRVRTELARAILADMEQLEAVVESLGSRLSAALCQPTERNT